MKKIAVSILVILALLWAGWLIAVPSSMMESEIEKRLKRGDISADLVGFRKGIFPGFRSEALDVMDSGSRVFSIEGLRGRPELVRSAKQGSAVVSLDGKAGGGDFYGIFGVKDKSYTVDLTLKGADLERLGLFEHTGLTGSGTLDAEAKFSGRSGEVKFQITGARLGPLDVSGRTVPMDMFHTVRGALSVKGRAVDVKSVTLEGKGLFARASGTIVGGMMDIKLDLMPEPEVDTLISVVAGQYKVSDGLYRIPVRRKLDL